MKKVFSITYQNLKTYVTKSKPYRYLLNFGKKFKILAIFFVKNWTIFLHEFIVLLKYSYLSC